MHLSIAQKREIFENKPLLQACYRHFAKLIAHYAPRGKIIEIGAGPGSLKFVWEGDLIATDLEDNLHIDHALDACHMFPVEDNTVTSLVGIEVLHHIKTPIEFMKEAERVLAPGGKIVLIEPWMTPLSYFFYRFFDHEDVYFDDYIRPGHEHDENYGNRAMAQVLLKDNLTQLKAATPKLRITKIRTMSFFDYQMTGGFKGTKSMLPFKGLYHILLSLDKILLPLMGLIGFRALIVIEKK